MIITIAMHALIATFLGLHIFGVMMALLTFAFVVRRFVDCMMVERPMSDAQKREARTFLHLLVFARWGGVYGLARETFPALRGPAGGAIVGAAAWLVGGNVLLPALNLTPSPMKLPLRTQAEALGEHVLAGAVTGAVYEALRR